MKNKENVTLSQGATTGTNPEITNMLELPCNNLTCDCKLEHSIVLRSQFSPNLILFKSNPIFFSEMYKLLQKLTWKYVGPRIFKAILEKE